MSTVFLRRPAFLVVLLFSLSLLNIAAQGPKPNGAGGPSWLITHTEGVYWLRTPQGRAFYSKGVNIVDGGKETEKTRARQAFYWANFFPSLAEWHRSVEERFADWGFNTRGAWSDTSRQLQTPLMVELDLGRLAKLHWFDPFHPDAEANTRRLAEQLTAPYRDDPNLVGYFTDNEVGWWNAPLFSWYLKKPWDNYTKQVLWRLLFDRYQGDWQRLLRDWVPQADAKGFEDLKHPGSALKLRPGGRGITVVNEFTYLCARRYYRLVHDALRRAHPQALVLGDRLPLYYNQDAVRAMVDYVDVVSTNYNVDVPDGWVAPYYFEGLRRLTGKPVLVSEFFFAAYENRTGNRNPGHLMTVATQRERATGAGNAVRNFARFPNVVGAHWFQYADEPFGGRGDGEDYNMGLVDIADRSYEELTETFSRVNRQLDSLHALAAPPADGIPASGYRIPAAGEGLRVGDGSLMDWDKAHTRLPGLQTPAPYVPFGDVHLAWAPEGLYLAVLASNYLDLALLDYQGNFPLSETFQIRLSVEDPTLRLHHYAVHLTPEPSERFADHLGIRPLLYRYMAGRPVERIPPEGHVHMLHKPLPHIAVEAFFPAQWLGHGRLTEGMELRMNVVLVTYYRELAMSWGGPVDLETPGQVPTLRSVVLEGAPVTASQSNSGMRIPAAAGG